MTTEEKAKAYDEALGRAKELIAQWIGKNKDFYTEDYSYIFPELRDSDDERIRKWIIEKVQGYADSNIPCPDEIQMANKALTYLEKQKEKFTAEEYENSELFQLKLKTKYANGYQDGLVQKEQSITANDLDEEIHRFFDDCIDVHEAKLYGDISERVIPVDCYELTARHFAKWGKRQKEQNHPNGCFTCDEYKKGYEAGRLNGITAGYNKAMKEQKPILEVFGFKVGDAVRLKDGDGRKHIIKSFEEVKGLHGPNFYHVEFEDNSAIDSIYPGEEYPNGYYTQMEKLEESKPIEPSDDELDRHQKELYDFKVFAAKQAKEHHISFVHDFEWNNFCCELLSYFAKQKPAEWSKEDEMYLSQAIDTLEHENYLILAEKLKSLRPQYHCDVTMTEAYKMGKEAGKQEQKSAEWSKEDEKMLNLAIEWAETMSGQFSFVDIDSTDFRKIIAWLKFFRPQSKDEIYKEKDEAFKLGKHQLAIKFMNYLDENRPEDKMGLSNSECEDIDKAFKENDWAKIMKYVEKYSPSWKPSEEQIGALDYAYCELFKRKDVGHNILGPLQKLCDELKKLM